MVRTLVAFGLCLATASPAAVITVDPGGAGDFTTIQPALAAAASGDVIELADGVYTGDENRNLDPAGKTLTIRSAGGDPTACVIDCQGTPGTTRRGFRFHSGEGRAFQVSGITIANGSAAPNGGLVSCTGGASPSFGDCILENGDATENGGAIYCSAGADPQFTGCVIRDNDAGYYGGGLRAISASAQFTRCRIENNRGVGGGGLSYYRCGPAVIEDCTFVANFGHRGGGIFLFDSEATVTGCEFTGNTCYAEGGGIDSVESQLTVTVCNFFGNEAGEFGGAISSADDISAPSGWLVAEDCLLAGNGSQRGGGVHAQYSDVTLRSCTLVANVGITLASGVTDFWGDVTLDRVIIADGQLTPAVHCEDPAQAPLFICSDIHGNAGGDWIGCIADQLGTAGNIDERPDFCDPVNGDYTLQIDSPCAQALCGFMGSEPVACDTPLATPPVSADIGRLLPVHPNPTGGGATVAWDLPRGGDLSVEILTVRGERVWRTTQTAGAGQGAVFWTGRDASGRTLAAGLYLVKLTVDGRLAGSDTVVLTR